MIDIVDVGPDHYIHSLGYSQCTFSLPSIIFPCKVSIELEADYLTPTKEHTKSSQWLHTVSPNNQPRYRRIRHKHRSFKRDTYISGHILITGSWKSAWGQGRSTEELASDSESFSQLQGLIPPVSGTFISVHHTWHHIYLIPTACNLNTHKLLVHCCSSYSNHSYISPPHFVQTQLSPWIMMWKHGWFAGRVGKAC